MYWKPMCPIYGVELGKGFRMHGLITWYPCPKCGGFHEDWELKNAPAPLAIGG